MTAPTRLVRQTVYARDEGRCCCCGATSPLSFQHRHNGLRRHPPTFPEGVTACITCNAVLFPGIGQQRAWRYGWAVRRWVQQGAVPGIPVFYQWAGVWALLTADGGRQRVGRVEAEGRMLAVYGNDWLEWAA